MSGILFGNNLRAFNSDVAAEIGINEAIMLQQLHYLLNPKFNKNIKDSRHWVYNSYAEWKEKEFPFWSEDTIQRTFSNLEKRGLVISKRLSKNSRDRTKWYSLNYEEISKLEMLIGTSPQNATMESHHRRLRSCITADCGLASPQNAMMSKVQENTQEITQEKTKHAREAASEIKAVEPPKEEPSIDLSVDHVCDAPVLEEKISDEKPGPKAAAPRLEKSKSAIQQNFELFWAAYTLKVGKGAAVKAFDRALKKTSLGAILSALEAQKTERMERERLGLWNPSWKHPSTWLNQECWNDVPRSAEEMQKEVEAKQVTRLPVAQKKPNFIDRHTENMQMMDDITMKYFPEFGKYFGSDKRVAMRNAAHNNTTSQFVREMIAHGV